MFPSSYLYIFLKDFFFQFLTVNSEFKLFKFQRVKNFFFVIEVIKEKACWERIHALPLFWDFQGYWICY